MSFEIRNGVLRNYRAKPGETEVIIPKGVKIIGDLAFCGSKLEHVIIPKGVKIIDDLAFVNCKYLRSIVIPDGVTSLGDRVFEGCSRLTRVTLPTGMTHTDTTTFSGCDGLTSLVANPDILQKKQLEGYRRSHFSSQPGGFQLRAGDKLQKISVRSEEKTSA